MTPAEALRACRKIINPPYKDKDWLVIFLTLFVLISIPLTTITVQTVREIRSRALAEKTLYLSPASQSINQGTNFTVQVRENSNTDPVSVVQALLTYDAAKLDFVSLDSPPVGTQFTWEIEGGVVGGSIRIVRGAVLSTPPQIITGDQLVATVTFRAKYAPGATAVSFAAGSGAVNANGDMVVSATSDGTYTVVDPLPTVTITNPADGATIKGTVNVTATALDDLGVTQVGFLVDGGLRSTDTTVPYEYSLNTLSPLLSDGPHTISAKAYDAHNTTTDTNNVTVDNNAPTNVSITAPAPNSYVRQTVTVQTNPTDTIGVTRVEFYIDGGATPVFTDNSVPFEYPWNTTSYTNAAHTLQVKAYDNANNVGTSPTISVTVDNIVPTVSITSPAAGAYLRSSVDVAANAGDTNLLNVEFSLDAVVKCTDTASPYTCTISLATTSDGAHTISAKANDRAGNNTTDSKPVTIDNTAPTAPTGLTATPVSSTQINLAWIASTDGTSGSGVAGYDVYRGGTKINAALITTTSYNDTGLTPATSYSYYVKAIDRAGNVSAASNTALATTPRTADLNGDGKVDIYDLSTLLSRWGTNDLAADLNGSGTVDIIDLGILISSWEG
jgi:hypothetical protein